MKTMTFTLICVITYLFFSCREKNKKKNEIVITKDTLQTKLESKEKEYLKQMQESEEQDSIDSIRLDKVLNDALKIATQNINKDKFEKKYEVIPDNQYNVKVEIRSDYYFTKSYPHLIIHRYGPHSVYIDIYNKNGGKFEKALSHEQWNVEYMNDTIRDINGDRFNDFVVNWYGSNGCCLKAFSNIYLLRSDKKTFSNNFEFINPTFSPNEKIIRGVGYGHPGDTEMYKYKWNGEKVDTLEYIYFEKNNKGKKTGKIIISKYRSRRSKEKIKRENSPPNEYKNIVGYEWFIG